MLTVNRVYEKRATEKSTWDGRVGDVELTIDAPKKGEIVMTLGGVELPSASVTYLMNFALQSLQDAYAGAATLDEAKANFTKKLKAVQEATIGARSEGVSTFTAVARSMVRGLLKAKHGAKSEAWTSFTALEDAEQNAKLDEVFAKNEATLRPKVEAEVARRAEEAARKRAITGGLDIEL